MNDAVDSQLSDAVLNQLFCEARSYNGWLDEPVSEAQIHQLHELVKMGPTSANQQPGRFVWCRTPDAKKRLAALASEGNRDKILAAPVTVIIAYDLDFHEQLPWLFPHSDARSWFADDADKRRESAFRNSVLQGAYLILAARAMGLDCGPMSGFDQDGVTAEFLAHEPRWRADWLCSVGHGDPASIFDRSPRPEFADFNTIV